MTVGLTVLVVGAGIGGLCLAQGLRGTGARVRVFERDPTRRSRGQGFRLRVDEHGTAALSRCLPGDLYRLFRATANPPHPPRGAVFDHRLEPLGLAAESLSATERRVHSTETNRGTLREILLAGLDGTVEFGHQVVAVRDTGDGVVARFADGTVATGDILVAADGVHSVVRAQLLPHAELVDTHLLGVYGRAILDRELRGVLPEMLLCGSPRVLGPAGVTLALGAYRPGESPQRAAARLAPYARLSHVADYMKWTLVAPPGTGGFAGPQLSAAAPSALHGLARRLTGDWHPALAHLVQCSDPAASFALSIRAAKPVDPWPTTRITLLGDAIHATTPAGGPGANLAMRDAALLTDRLAEVAAGGADPRTALAGYEDEMRRYGFAAATRSLTAAEKIFQARVPALS
jgi:2-polyprenyl-6-methoxyphenol hydroxylase-like FAD-dependent oxidoreductase